GDDRVKMVRSRDCDGVKIAGFAIEHFAPVEVEAGPRVGFEGCGGHVLVNIANGDDLLALTALDVGESFIAGADRGDAKPFTARLASDNRRRQDKGQLTE